MADPAEVQGTIEDAVKSGQYPDRKSAVAGLTKQLIDLQKGALAGTLDIDPVDGIEKVRGQLWQAMLAEAGGDEDKAVRLYADELKKLAE